MDEPRFLHQSALWDGETVTRVPDLPAATSARAGRICRGHAHAFHVPIHRTELSERVQTTQADTLAGLAAARTAGAKHIAVETYTWSILTDDDSDRIIGTVNELAWLHDHIAH